MIQCFDLSAAPSGFFGYAETWARDPRGLPFDRPPYHVHRIGAAVMGSLVGLGKGGSARYHDGRCDHHQGEKLGAGRNLGCVGRQAELERRIWTANCQSAGVVVDEVGDRHRRLAAIGMRLGQLDPMSSVTSRDQPSAVLKATMRTGDEYWPSSRWRISVARSASASSVSRQERPSRSPKSSSTR